MVNWAEIRKHLMLDDNCIYLNSGGLGPNPKTVLDAQLNFLRKRNVGHGPCSSILQKNVEKEILNIRGKIATFLGLQSKSNSEEIIFTSNTTEAIRLVLDAIKFSPNEHILITDLEHDTALYNCIIIYQKFGVDIKKVSLYGNHRDSKIIPEFIKKQITPDTRLLLISHISYSTGIRLPIEEIVRTCKASFPNLLILIDGAHATGQIDVNLKKINCDFYATDAHKWLLGPEGIGLLFVRREFLDNPNKINFHFLRGLSVDTKYEPNSNTFQDLLSSQSFSLSSLINSKRNLELGTVNRSDILGLGAAIEFLNNIGIRNVEKRISFLAGTLRQKLRSLPKIKIISPDEKNLSSGIISFQIEGLDSYDKLKNIIKKLEGDYNIICRAIPYPKCIRACTHFFNNERDIDTFVKVISQLLSSEFSSSI